MQDLEQDPRAEQLAAAHWRHARQSPVAWERLEPAVRAELTEQADTWLRAARAAGIVAPAAAPSEDHTALWLDEAGGVWNDIPTADGDGGDLVLPLVHAHEEAVSRRDLAERGHRLTLIGWTR
ncbi:hypothetical protein [Kitasatospora purpeofusca]|uniref:hypothetical protein n=1 Tax=Kitasatospora purpeofusca TaxID=67352 RepID=UPI002A59AAEB|nr:hypothetical protein [Kitasatospora purpeofusca]MDY0816775.1 hypothetical protein [Kitasatospora purpeofusca]